MSIAQSLIPEFDHEMAGARTMLERLPEDKLEFKPDPKSMSLGRLAGHIAEMPGWGSSALNMDSLDMNPGGKPGFEALVAKSRQQVLAAFDKNVSDARAALATASDAHLMMEWKLLSNGVTLMAMPRLTVVRTFVMNHVIHHRAQLGVYYRMNGIPLPALYGPSADEGQMGGGAAA
jgi:uncharacterized damage-inducible protein DinB